jgi:hypothetical protein
MLNGAALMQMREAAAAKAETPPADVSVRVKGTKPAMKPAQVKQAEPAAPKKRGRPKMTEEQKAAARAAKANSANIPQQKAA